MKISTERLKQIIKEELEEDNMPVWVRRTQRKLAKQIADGEFTAEKLRNGLILIRSRSGLQGTYNADGTPRGLHEFGLSPEQVLALVSSLSENNNEPILERSVGPSVYPAFKAVRDLYNEAVTNEDKKKIEGDIIFVFNNIINLWREERNEPETSEYPEI
jgi:hypothetical protein